jgi:hypothetical protein
MDRKDAMTWVLSVCVGLGVLRKSQAKTLSHLVAATLAAARISLAGIGRELAAMEDGAAKHAIKKAWRFCANSRIEPVEVMPALINRLWRRRLTWHAKKPVNRPLLVSLDWTKVRKFHTLMAALVVQGRALPFGWESYRDKVQHKSQNDLEYAMLLKLKAAVPAGIRIVVLADRGFGRAALAQVCQNLKLDYLIRIDADVIVKTERWQGNLKHYPLQRGMCRSWASVDYRSDALIKTNLIARWKKGLEGDKDQPWYLITSLKLGKKGEARRLSNLYALRFDIEELFRDAKNEHLGWSLGKTRITKPERLDRLILILALAYLLLVALGLWCRQHKPARLWASNNRREELSAYAIGRVMLDRLGIKIATLLTLLLRSLQTTKGKWG